MQKVRSLSLTFLGGVLLPMNFGLKMLRITSRAENRLTGMPIIARNRIIGQYGEERHPNVIIAGNGNCKNAPRGVMKFNKVPIRQRRARTASRLEYMLELKQKSISLCEGASKTKDQGMNIER